MRELKSCPFCGGKANIIVCDDDGNHHSEEYENDPWSGLGFMLEHNEEDNPNCPIAHEKYEQCGRKIYDTKDEAIEVWNTRFYPNNGKWVKTCVPDVFQCTNCKHPTKMDELCDSKMLRAYCPNCGAKMDMVVI